MTPSPQYTPFFYKNTFYKDTEAEIWYHLFQKMGKYSPITKVCQMKHQVKRRSLSTYLGVGVSGKLQKIGLKLASQGGGRYGENFRRIF